MLFEAGETSAPLIECESHSRMYDFMNCVFFHGKQVGLLLLLSSIFARFLFLVVCICLVFKPVGPAEMRH